MTINAEILNFFPVPVYKSTLSFDFTDKQKAFIEKNVKKQNLEPPNIGGNAVSSNDRVLDNRVMKSIKSDVQKHIDNFLEIVYKPTDDYRLEITQSWLSITKKGQSHHMHHHANSIASGVIYISTAEKDAINFLRKNGKQASFFSENSRLHLPTKGETYHNAYSYTVPVKKLDILIFPSQLEHQVSVVKEDVSRISLAFNTFVSGSIGLKGSYTLLEVKPN